MYGMVLNAHGYRFLVHDDVVPPRGQVGAAVVRNRTWQLLTVQSLFGGLPFAGCGRGGGNDLIIQSRIQLLIQLPI